MNDKDNEKIALIGPTFFINTLDFRIFIYYICETKFSSSMNKADNIFTLGKNKFIKYLAQG